MKVLKFRKKLSELILNRDKTITWRLFDDKDLQEKELVSLIIWETGKEFAKAEITEIIEKRFSELTEEDKQEHEKFSSDEKMYQTYSKYYGKEVTPETLVKIIKFQLTK